MSDIDTVEHSRVGTFGGLPVYHPLQKIDKRSTDFYADYTNLVIGGGSGEHPALVIKNLDACVLDFLEFVVERTEKEADSLNFFNDWYDSVDNDTIETYRPYRNLEFCYWSLDQTVEFTNKINESFNSAIQYEKKRKDFEKLNSEKKITIMLGEFLFFSGKHLLSEKLRDYIEKNINEVENSVEYIEAFFYALQVVPPGYPANGGKISLYENGMHKTSWDLRFDQENKCSVINNARNGDLEGIKYLQSIGCDLTKDNHYALRASLMANHIETAEYLMSQGLSLEFINAMDIVEIAHKGHKEAMEYLVDKDVNIYNEIDSYACGAALGGKLDMLKFLVKSGASIDHQLLTNVIESDSPEIAEYVLKQGADISYLTEHANEKIAQFLKEKNIVEMNNKLDNDLPTKKVVKKSKM